MFVIIEGIDCAGKSTLATQVVDALSARGDSVEELHRGVPERAVLDEYQLDVELYRPNQGRSIVADRWHWGEPVYGELYRGKSELGVAGMRFVELFLRSRGAITVLAEAPSSVILQRFEQRGEDYLKPEDVDRVLAHYGELYDLSATGVLRTELDGPVNDVVEQVLQHGDFWANLTADLEPYQTYVGDRTPGVLLLGEERSDTSVSSLTAFRPDKINSAHYLLNALPGSIWRSVGLANLFEEPDLEGLLETLAQPPIIALGRRVSDELKKRGIEHGSVPHPQWVKRFKHSEQAAYGQLIHDTMQTGEENITWPKSSTYEI